MYGWGQSFNWAALTVAWLLTFAIGLANSGAVRAEDAATQHAGNSGSCARSTFRVLIDVGHTATSPGADSASAKT